MLLGAGGAAKETYVDDVFSTYLWTGNSTSNRNINNGIDLSNEEGMVWIKKRSADDDNLLYDTLRGHNERLITNSDTDNGGLGGRLTGFNSNGFELGDNTQVNASSNEYASWTFRTAPGFFDVVAYTGNGTSGRAISHNLGCNPGFVVVKRKVGGVGDWKCLHRYDFDKYLELNNNQAAASSSADFPSHPTSTTFTVSSDAAVNKDGDSYMAYLFAGGESTATGARSVSFDGSDDYLSLASSSDFAFGTGDFTIEFWVKPHSTSGSNQLLDFRTDGGSANQTGKFNLGLKIQDEVILKGPSNTPDIGVPHSKHPVNPGVWSHIAVVRNSSTTTIYVNGIAGNSASDSNDYTDATLLIGKSSQSPANYLDGEISNFRVVKGTAVYTSAFRPPTEPLTNITNTKLLCCQNSQASYATVAPNSITASGGPTVSDSISPFDDPAGFVFGDSKEGIIKCGSYKGNGSSTGPEIYLGWEPQYLLVKRTDAASHWYVVDSIRGFTADDLHEPLLSPNQNGSNSGGAWTDNYYGISLTGFNINTTSATFNADGGSYIYIAIRRPDGYVGKPAELGTDVFAMDTGNSSNCPPGSFDSNFPVDFALYRKPAASDDWITTARKTGTKYLETNQASTESTDNGALFDSNVGWYNQASGTYQSWMWKRHAGFDLVTYTGNGTAGRGIPHSLNKIPEMMWVKYRNSGTYGWVVYHKGLNGGSSPEGYYLRLDTTGVESTGSSLWNDTAPTSTVFTVGTNPGTNSNTANYIAMLFTSVDGISKCGYYSGSTFEQTITTGFQPRFVIIRQTDEANWTVLDTTRGWSSGSNDAYLLLNTDGDETSTADMGHPTSTGFQVSAASENSGLTNQNGFNYIYYAHA